MQTDVPPGRMSGGPVLQTEVTDAITNAFFEELAEVGYGRLSIDAVARRAGVGKAAIYRRWKSKLRKGCSACRAGDRPRRTARRHRYRALPRFARRSPVLAARRGPGQP